MILAGGFGTRLRPLSCTRPKILFPIVNKPLLQWIFERLSESNITEVILAVNQQTEFYIRQQRIPKQRLIVRYSRDPRKLPLGTGGPVKKAEKLIGYEEDFLAINGDVFSDLSYRELMDKHRETKALATIALYEVEDPSRYGVAEIAEDGRIKTFVEKPTKDTAPSNLINAGVYVLSPAIFEYIPPGMAVSMEREVFPKLVEIGQLYGHVIKGIWIDIGKPEEYLRTNKIILDTIINKQKQPRADKYEIRNPVAFDKGVSIGEKSVIGPYVVLGKNVAVGKNVQISDSVVFRDVRIEDSASVTGAIIGEDAVIERKVKIGRGCIIGDRAKVKENVSLTGGVVVCPENEVANIADESRII